MATNVVAEFIAHPRASLSTRDCPVRSAVDAEADSAYQVHTAAVKALKDLDQVLRVPEFDGWETVNIVCLRFPDDWMYYWVGASRTSSTVNGAVEFSLTYNGPASQLAIGGSYTASVMRSPEFCATKQCAVISGAMEMSRSLNLGSIPSPPGYKAYWVQVTASEYMTNEAPMVRESDRLARYGFFAAFNLTNQLDKTLYAYGTNYPMPSLFDIINNPESIGLSSAAVITDISVSEICPYRCSMDSDGVYSLYLYSTGTVTATAYAWGGSMVYMWNLDSMKVIPQTIDHSVTLTLSEMEQTCGNITIRDHSGSTVANIPAEWFGTSHSLALTTRILSDFGSLTYRIEVNGTVIQAPCGHLPYVGSAWLEYVAYSMAYDRASMENSIDTATRQTELAISTSAANGIIGLLSTDPVSALQSVLGQYVTAWSSREANEISAGSLRSQQNITEKRMQAQPGTVYSSQYGIGYCYQTFYTPMSIQVSIPAGLTPSIYEAYRDAFGLPCETVDAETTLTAGYWQLRFSTQDGLDSGPRFDRLNQMITNGLRITGVI